MQWNKKGAASPKHLRVLQSAEKLMTTVFGDTEGILMIEYKSRAAQAALYKCGYQIINHPSYSPDLATSEYYLFSNMKKELRGKSSQVGC